MATDNRPAPLAGAQIHNLLVRGPGLLNGIAYDPGPAGLVPEMEDAARRQRHAREYLLRE